MKLTVTAECCSSLVLLLTEICYLTWTQQRYPYVHTHLSKDTHRDDELWPRGGFVIAESCDSPVYLVSGGKALPVLLHEVNVLRGVVEWPFIGQEPVQGAPRLVAGEAASGSGSRRYRGA